GARRPLRHQGLDRRAELLPALDLRRRGQEGRRGPPGAGRPEGVAGCAEAGSTEGTKDHGDHEGPPWPPWSFVTSVTFELPSSGHPDLRNPLAESRPPLRELTPAAVSPDLSSRVSARARGPRASRRRRWPPP